MTTTLDPLSSARSGQSGSATANAQMLGQNEFLKLMVAQLKNQDPTKPLDPTAFVSQLAQFSTVTGIENMRSSMDGLISSMRSSQALDGASLIGHSVLAPADTTTIASGETVRGGVDVPEGVTRLEVQVEDAAGQLVRTFMVAPQSGLAEFTWDGKTSTGTDAPSGTYRFKVIAHAGGQSSSLQPMLESRILSVTIDPATAALSLNTNNGSLALDSVRRVL